MITIKMYEPHEQDWRHGQRVIYFAKRGSLGPVCYEFGCGSVEFYWENVDDDIGVTVRYNEGDDSGYRLGDSIVTADCGDKYVLTMRLSDGTPVDAIAYMVDAGEYVADISD